VVFRDKRDGTEHVAMVRGKVQGLERRSGPIHSECLTSEVFAA